MLRAIFLFHREVRGWNDIGYNFVIDAFGRIVRGARRRHRRAGRRRTGRRLQPRLDRRRRARIVRRPADLRAAPGERLQRLLAWKLSLHGVPAQRARDRARQPGRRRLQPLPGQRARVAAAHRRPPRRRHHRLPRRRAVSPAAGHPSARARPRATTRARDARADARRRRTAARLRRRRPSAPPAPPALSRQRGGLAGTLTFLDGTPLAGATVQIQARSVSRRGEVGRRADARAGAVRRRRALVAAGEHRAVVPRASRYALSTSARPPAPAGRRKPARRSRCRSRWPLRRSAAAPAPAPTPAAARPRAR